MNHHPAFLPTEGADNAVHTSGPMKGFDAEFKDLDQYIRVITDRIWEGRRLGDIRTYYSDPCVVETAMSVSTSVEDVVKGTEATLAMFPDRRLLAEDVIVSGDTAGGYLSSHRIISPMTHAGDGSFGPATGRTIHARTIADWLTQRLLAMPLASALTRWRPAMRLQCNRLHAAWGTP